MPKYSLLWVSPQKQIIEKRPKQDKSCGGKCHPIDADALNTKDESKAVVGIPPYALLSVEETGGVEVDFH